MANVAPSGIALYAALCEEIYLRNKFDLPMSVVDELDVSKIARADFDDAVTNPHLNAAKLANGWVVDDDGYIYQMTDPSNPSDTTPDNGFVARVVSKTDGTKIIVFRGSDLSGDGWELFKSTINPQWTDESDGYDWRDNGALGAGTWDRSQFDDALALTEAVKAQYGAENVVVTGQSLGGGLAGLVSAVANVEGYAFAPAPFNRQLEVVSQTNAIENILKTDGQAGQHGEKFTQTFIDLTLPEKSSILANISQDPNVSLYIKSEFISDSAQIEQDYLDLTGYWEQIYHTNIFGNLLVSTVKGEILTSGAVAWLLSLGSEHFVQGGADNWYDIGSSISEANDASLHGSMLHALAALTEGGNSSFVDLLKDDGTLTNALLGDEPGIAGVIEGTRDDDYDVASKVIGGNPNPATMLRALWKSIVDDEDKLYDYFHELFKNVATKGSAADEEKNGIGSNDNVSLHSGITKLALGVLRDALTAPENAENWTLQDGNYGGNYGDSLLNTLFALAFLPFVSTCFVVAEICEGSTS